ncbi:MAG: ATPase, T2SS/T4P/T4SS family [Verrucomicrobiota bacterium]
MNSLFIDAAKKAGCEDAEALQEVVDEATGQQRSVIDAILDARLVPEDPFLRAVAEELGIPFREVLKDEDAKPHHLRKVCSAQLALKHRVLPLVVEKLVEVGGSDNGSEDDDGVEEGEGEEQEEEKASASKGKRRLRMVTYDPFNLVGRQTANQMIPMPIVWEMSSRTRVIDALQGLYGVGADTFEQLLAGRDVDADAFDQKEETNIIDDDDEEASVVKFVNQIIREALEQRATDIHVEPLEDNLRIRYRVDGILVEVPVPDQINALQSSVIARLKIMSRLDIAERRLPQDGRIALQVEGEPIDVRVATVPTVEGESVSLRLLGQERFTIEKLNLESTVREPVEKLLSMSNGIVLITGPTGSGKSTTLYSFLSELNKPETRIVTVEDPVENKLEGVMQIAVKPEINLTFANGLRSILRADPNIVMIGEIRDLETAEIAVRASLTGHLVFSTLHTNDSIGGISRLTDMGVEPFLVSASVRSFIAQRLVRKLCSICKRPAEEMSSEMMDQLGFPEDRSGTIYEAVGCRECRESGYHGRLAIYENCLITPKIQDLIVGRASSAAIRAQADKEGFISLRDYGWMKVLSGDTTVEEVVSVTSNELEGEESSPLAAEV